LAQLAHNRLIVGSRLAQKINKGKNQIRREEHQDDKIIPKHYTPVPKFRLNFCSFAIRFFPITPTIYKQRNKKRLKKAE